MILVEKAFYFLSVCIVLYSLQLHQEIRAMFLASKTGLKSRPPSPKSFPTYHSKAVPLLQFFSVLSGFISGICSDYLILSFHHENIPI